MEKMINVKADVIMDMMSNFIRSKDQVIYEEIMKMPNDSSSYGEYHLLRAFFLNLQDSGVNVQGIYDTVVKDILENDPENLIPQVITIKWDGYRYPDEDQEWDEEAQKYI